MLKKKNSFIGDMYLAWAEGNTVPLSGETPWYRAGGAPAPVAAWQPIGAASLAASYLNLVTPGTYDAAPGVAPVLHANGWTANNSAFLTTGLVPDGIDWTVLVRIISVTNTLHAIMGVYHSATQALMIRRVADDVNYYNGGGVYDGGGAFPTGVLGVAGKNTYRDGIDTADIAASGTNPTGEIFIMAYNNGAGSPVAKLQSGYIAAMAVWDSTLTAPQVLAVSTAMAAL